MYLQGSGIRKSTPLYGSQRFKNIWRFNTPCVFYSMKTLDWRLVRYFDADFQVTTVSRQGWKGKRNGELLAQAAEAFDALVTMDKGIEHEQNLRKYTISIILISAKSNRIQDIEPAMFRVNQILRTLEPGQVSHVTVTT